MKKMNRCSKLYTWCWHGQGIVAPRSCMLAPLTWTRYCCTAVMHACSTILSFHSSSLSSSLSVQFLAFSLSERWCTTSCLSISIFLSWKISVCRTKSLIMCLSIPKIRTSPTETFSHMYHDQSGTNQICTPLRELTSLILCKGNSPCTNPLSLYKKQIINVSVATHISPSITHKHMNFSSSTIWFNRDPEDHGNLHLHWKFTIHCSYFPLFL